MEFADFGNTVVFEKPFLQQLIDQAVKVGVDAGIKKYKESKMKDEILTTSEVAKLLKVTTPTVINYIQSGHRLAGKLKATTTGKNYKVNRYDLHLFKKKMSE